MSKHNHKHDKCKCGNSKLVESKLCAKCFHRSKACKKPAKSGPFCSCPASDALTCQAKRHKMSPFSAWLEHGVCTCSCHRKAVSA